MTVNDMYEIEQYIVNKNQNGYLSPDEFNLINRQAQYSYLNYLLGQFQQYQAQRPMPRVQYSENQRTRQSLTPLIYGYNLNVDVNGRSPYPGDYQQTDAMWTLYGLQKIKYVEQNFVSSYFISTINPIATNPIYLIEDGGFKFYPLTLGNAKLNYVRTPPDIIWGYDLGINGLPIYNPSKSQDPVWYDTDIFEIIVRALKIVSVNLQAAQVSSLAQDIIKGGQ